MHMADALISPAVGGAMWAVAAGISAYSIKKLKNDTDYKIIPITVFGFIINILKRKNKKINTV